MLLVCTLAPLLLCAPAAGAAGRPAELKIAWVGNSYTYYHDLPLLLERLAASAPEPVTVSHDSVTVGGSSLSRLAEDGSVQQMLEQDWDYVVLQDQSQIPGGARPADRDLALASLELFYKPALHRIRAEALLYSTWGRRDGDTAYPSLYPDFLAMNRLTGEGYQLYRDAADNPPLLPATIAPAGAAFEFIYSLYPWLFTRLYDPDGSHPSVLGSYLVSCVFYVHLTKKPSEGLPYFPTGVEAHEATLLQQVADQVVLGGQTGGVASTTDTTTATAALRQQKPPASAMPLTILPAAEATQRGAVCLDGSPPGLYFRPASTAAMNSSWVIFMKGGAWCTSAADCAGRSRGNLGSSTKFSSSYSVRGPLDPDPASNPTFAGFNHVMVFYCDGARSVSATCGSHLA
jgi:hypothetical protein